MPLATFREKRTGKFITHSYEEGKLAEACPLYMWAYEIVDIRPLSFAPPRPGDQLNINPLMVKAYDSLAAIKLEEAEKEADAWAAKLGLD